MSALTSLSIPATALSIDLKISFLYYFAPVLTVACFFLAKLRAGIRLEKPSSNHNSRNRRYAAIPFAAAVTLTFIVQLGSYVSDTLTKSMPWPAEPEIMYCLSSVLVHITIAAGLCEDHDINWNHHAMTWLVALAFDVSIALWIVLEKRSALVLETAHLRLHLSRILVLLVSCIISFWFQRHPSPSSTACGSKSKSTRTEKGAGAAESDISDLDPDFDSEGESPEADKKLKEQQSKRLEEAGDWLSFLGQYKVFVPLLWPSGDRMLQLCVVGLGLHLLGTRVLGILVPTQMGIITDKLTTGAASGQVPWREIVWWMMLSAFESEFFFAVRDFAFLPVQQYAYKAISATAFRHVMGLSMEFHNEKSSSELVRTVEQGQRLQDMLSFVCFEVSPVFADMAIALVYITCTFDAYMTFIVVLGGVGYVWLGLLGVKWSVKARRRYNKAMREQSRLQYEGLNNWATVSQFNRGKYESDRYNDYLDKYNKAERDMYFAYNGISSLQGCVMTAARLAATALAMYRVSQGAIPVGHLVSFTAVWSTIMSPITCVTYMMKRWQSMLVDSERLLQLLQTKPSVVESPNAKELALVAGRVEFEHVDFSYDPRKPTVSDVSFVAEPGMTVALVGETGGGKSTVLKLLYRYFDVGGGSIRIDGQDIRHVTLDSLREGFGVVPQDPALFNISLMENLRYARLDATDEEVMAACRAACIHDKITGFPDGYGCKVGERGVKLSGGEMQRVAIARAILKEPRLVLLDEATSMIDAETEAEIQKALRRLTAGRTTFVIAHRLSTVQHADLILVVQDGAIIERGSHEELVRADGKYVALWSRQMSKGVGFLPCVPEVDTSASTPISSNDEEEYSADSEEESKGYQPRGGLRKRRAHAVSMSGGESE